MRRANVVAYSLAWGAPARAAHAVMQPRRSELSTLKYHFLRRSAIFGCPSARHRAQLRRT